MRLSSLLFLSSLLLVGCTSHSGVSPSQNSSLSSVSPSATATSQGGLMQESLNAWLKEDWIPNTTTNAAQTPKTTSNGSAPAAASIDPTVITDEKPFTLQSYADKWKVYHENKEKINAGKPKEASHIDAVNALPVIGK
jgi:hypothetical protein